MRMCGPVGGLLTALAVVFGTAVAFAPVPRITWEHREVQLVQFHEPGIFNYSALLLSENEDTLFVGAREAVFALNAHNISKKQHEKILGTHGSRGSDMMTPVPPRGSCRTRVHPHPLIPVIVLCTLWEQLPTTCSSSPKVSQSIS